MPHNYHSIKPASKLFRHSYSLVVRKTWCFKLPLALSSLLGIAFLVLVILSILDASSPFSLCVVRSITLFLKFLSNIAAATIIAHEKNFQAISHPLTLRLHWFASFTLSLILSTSAINRLSSSSFTILTDDIISIIFLLFSSVLLVFAAYDRHPSLSIISCIFLNLGKQSQCHWLHHRFRPLTTHLELDESPSLRRATKPP